MENTGANLEEREHLAFLFPVQQIVVVLHGYKWGEVVRDRVACRSMVSRWILQPRTSLTLHCVDCDTGQ